MSLPAQPKIVVLGLGYVGLPLAVALAAHFEVVGFDIDHGRIAELTNGHDRTAEVETERLLAAALTLTNDPAVASGADVYIVTVPTPVDADNRPDLGPVLAASRSVANMIDPARHAIIIYESTVYPGVTEQVCGPAIEAAGTLRRGQHFRLGYSPERINPGDREHTVERIVKVIAGEDHEVTEALAALYGRVTSAGVFRAASIQTAEAAKVIENAQRDINIAFMNEVTQIFARIDLSVWDVLEAAGTKWNFLRFQPGLVGGHCIGVDPYYLSHLSQALGHDPQVILSGRTINDGMADWLAAQVDARRPVASPRTLVLGITFKENVPDLRNSKVVDLVTALQARGHQVTLHDPLADAQELHDHYALSLTPEALSGHYDIVLCAVPHANYVTLPTEDIERMLTSGGLVGDIKGIWRDRAFSPGVDRWTL